jgi:3-hydroxybutyryl-CoA dehydrogenase
MLSDNGDPYVKHGRGVMKARHEDPPVRLTPAWSGSTSASGIARYLAGELGPRFTPPQPMIDMVERGDLGRKTGRGFYDWPEET